MKNAWFRVILAVISCAALSACGGGDPITNGEPDMKIEGNSRSFAQLVRQPPSVNQHEPSDTTSYWEQGPNNTTTEVFFDADGNWQGDLVYQWGYGADDVSAITVRDPFVGEYTFILQNEVTLLVFDQNGNMYVFDLSDMIEKAIGSELWNLENCSWCSGWHKDLEPGNVIDISRVPYSHPTIPSSRHTYGTDNAEAFRLINFLRQYGNQIRRTIR